MLFWWLSVTFGCCMEIRQWKSMSMIHWALLVSADSVTNMKNSYKKTFKTLIQQMLSIEKELKAILIIPFVAICLVLTSMKGIRYDLANVSGIFADFRSWAWSVLYNHSSMHSFMPELSTMAYEKHSMNSLLSTFFRNRENILHCFVPKNRNQFNMIFLFTRMHNWKWIFSLDRK